MAHQFGAVLLVADHRAGRRQQICGEPAPVGQGPGGQAPNADAECAVDEVGDQHGLGQSEGGVVADQEEPAVARKAVQPVDIGLTQIDDRIQPLCHREDRLLHRLDAVRLIDEGRAHLDPICRFAVPARITQTD